jgi:hypothetical protein
MRLPIHTEPDSELDAELGSPPGRDGGETPIAAADPARVELPDRVG